MPDNELKIIAAKANFIVNGYALFHISMYS